MVQESTKEFAHRFNEAVRGHPLAPATTFGMQSWLRGKLEKETGLEVSPNTMSKWFNGGATPRADNIRKIAQVLQVDEVWLSLGRRPVENRKDAATGVGNTRGPVLALAGLLEMRGARVSFQENPESPVDLQVSTPEGGVEIVVVTPRESDGVLTFVIPEPVGDARIVSVTTGPAPQSPTATADLVVVDLTDCPRQFLGGYSILALTKRKDGRFKAEGQRTLIPVLDSLDALTPA